MRKPVIPLLAVLAWGCSDGDAAPDWKGVVRDSAGVQVVENPAEALWRPGEEWTLTEALRIGTLEGEAAYQFGAIASLAVDDHGRLYALDQQAREVRVFDEGGRHVETLGRPGSGPGELGMALPFVFVRRDSVLVVDAMNQRVTIFAGGDDATSFPLDFTKGIPTAWSKDPSDRLIVQLRGMGMPGMAAHEGGDPIVFIDEQGALGDTVLLLPRGESFDMTGGVPRMRIFAPEPVWSMGEDGRIVSGKNSGYRLEVRDPDGTLRRVITRAFETQPITEGEQTRLRATLRSFMESQGAPPAAVSQLIDQMQFADSYPAFATLVAGPWGTTWVQRVRSVESLDPGTFGPEALGSPDWDVFDEDGRYLGAVRTPDGFRPLVVRGDHLYGVGVDDMEVPVVLKLEVSRGS